MTLETIGSACADPAAAVISRFGVARACEQRAVFDHAASLMVYHWVCADGFKPADVAPVVRATNTTTAQLVDVFGEERWHDIDGALFDATKAVVDWSAARAKAASAALDAREVAGKAEAAQNDPGGPNLPPRPGNHRPVG